MFRAPPVDFYVEVIAAPGGFYCDQLGFTETFRPLLQCQRQPAQQAGQFPGRRPVRIIGPGARMSTGTQA